MGGSTSYDAEGFGYDEPDAPFIGRNLRRAFSVGFTLYVWTAKAARTTDERDRRARRRYRQPSMIEAFTRGWDTAAKTTPIPRQP